MAKPNKSHTLTQMKAYIRTNKLNKPEIKLGMKKAEMVAALKKIGHWDYSNDKKPQSVKEIREAMKKIPSKSGHKDKPKKEVKKKETTFQKPPAVKGITWVKTDHHAQGWSWEGIEEHSDYKRWHYEHSTGKYGAIKPTVFDYKTMAPEGGSVTYTPSQFKKIYVPIKKPVKKAVSAKKKPVSAKKKPVKVDILSGIPQSQILSLHDQMTKLGIFKK